MLQAFSKLGELWPRNAQEEPPPDEQRPPHRIVPRFKTQTLLERQSSEQRERLEPHSPDFVERRKRSLDGATLHETTSASAPLQYHEAPKAASLSLTSTNLELADRQLEELRLARAGAVFDLPGEQYAGPREGLESISDALEDLQILQELDTKWLLNLSMHFRDKSDREKFFVTYIEQPNKWRRMTISCDYRNAQTDSLEGDIRSLLYQREKSGKIYESLRDSLADIQFFPTVTNLKLQTTNGRLHVHITEDINEVVRFPDLSLLPYLECARYRECEVEFDSHLSGFVYKVKIQDRFYIKKEIPSPDAVEEFLYEINALSSLRDSAHVIPFEGLIIDDSGQTIRGLVVSYAESGALIDILYDLKDTDALPWSRRERWAKQIVQGLSDVHESGFVQGDFTLSNIVIDGNDNANIIDINRRGCPVGWEPPEMTEMIQAGQKISLYIGVKSDMYQLGMVLWALAEVNDEPERVPRPLRPGRSWDGVPDYYMDCFEICYSEDPRERKSAKEILDMFPNQLSDSNASGQGNRPDANYDLPNPHTPPNRPVVDDGEGQETAVYTAFHVPLHTDSGFNDGPVEMDPESINSSENYTGTSRSVSGFGGKHEGSND